MKKSEKELKALVDETKADMKALLSEYFGKLGSAGGNARAAKLSKPRRIEIARNAGKAKGKKAG